MGGRRRCACTCCPSKIPRHKWSLWRGWPPHASDEVRSRSSPAAYQYPALGSDRDLNAVVLLHSSAYRQNEAVSRSQTFSSDNDNDRDLLPLWGSLPWIPPDHLDAGLPGLERTKQGGGRRSDRTQYTAIIRKHAGREDPQQFDGRSAFQKATAGCPEHQQVSHLHVQHRWEVLAGLNLDQVGQRVTAPVPRPLPRLPMATIRRPCPSEPGSTVQPRLRPSDRFARRTRSRWR